MDLLVLWNLSRLVRRCLTNMVRAVLNCVDTSLIAPHTFASVSVSVSVSLSFTSLKRWIVFASQPFSRCPQCATFSSTSLCASVLLLNTVCQRIHDLLCEDKKTEVVDLAMASECRGCPTRTDATSKTYPHYLFPLQLQPATSVRLQTKTNPPPGSSAIAISVHKCRCRASLVWVLCTSNAIGFSYAVSS